MDFLFIIKKLLYDNYHMGDNDVSQLNLINASKKILFLVLRLSFFSYM